MRTKLIFPGKPISKDNRALIGRDGKTGRPVIRHPKRYVDWEEKIAWEAKSQILRDDRFPIKDLIPIEVWITFYYPYRPTTLDLLNSPKGFCDALNKVAWEDDKQIWEAHLRKRYDKANPRIELEIRVMDRREMET